MMKELQQTIQELIALYGRSNVLTAAMICQCDKCGHDWIPRVVTVPKQCPMCKSTRWNAAKEV